MTFDLEQCVKNGVEQAVQELELATGMTLKEAAEKQIPKKIENAHIIWNRFDAIDHWEGSCPNCKTNIRFSVDGNYCFYCGQALDWSDTE